MASDTNSSKPIKRRSRSSKRTPTTLLTTNPTNFRALVQQFTGCHPNKTLPNSSLIGSQKGPINLDFQLGSVSLQNNNQRTINYEPSFGNFSDHTNDYDQFQTAHIQLQQQQLQHQFVEQTCVDALSEDVNVENRSSEIGLDDLDSVVMIGNNVDLMDDVASLQPLRDQNFDQGYYWNMQSQYPPQNISCQF